MWLLYLPVCVCLCKNCVQQSNNNSKKNQHLSTETSFSSSSPSIHFMQCFYCTHDHGENGVYVFHGLIGQKAVDTMGEVLFNLKSQSHTHIHTIWTIYRYQSAYNCLWKPENPEEPQGER